MDFCYLTISGGYFISQLAILVKLYKARNTFLQNFHFDGIFAASGGNIAAYLSLLFTNNETSIERKLDKLNYSIFIRDWSKGHIKTNLLSYLQSSLYTEGSGMYEFFNNHFENFNNHNLPEIWSLCYNQDVDCGALFCSKSIENCIFQCNCDSEMIKAGVGIVTYLDGNMKLISDICTASAAIPGVVKPVNVDNSLYIDGGVLNATSGSYFVDVPLEANVFHYYYVLPCRVYDIDVKQKFNNKKKESHWTSSIFNAVQSMTTSQIINDKNFMFENWKRRSGKSKNDIRFSIYHDINDKKMSDLLKDINDKHFFMILYTDMYSVDIGKFTSADLKDTFRKAIKSVTLELYL